MINVTSGLLKKPSTWHTSVLLCLAFWLSSSLLIDLVIMPGLYMAGMMSQPDFASAGFSIFWIFNRIEVLCAGVILTGLLFSRQHRNIFAVTTSGSRSRWALWLGSSLLVISLIYTYFLTPEMGALGISLDAFATTEIVPNGMNTLHGIYWSLEVIKLALGTGLFALCYRDMSTALD